MQASLPSKCSHQAWRSRERSPLINNTRWLTRGTGAHQFRVELPRALDEIAVIPVPADQAVGAKAAVEGVGAIAADEGVGAVLAP